MESPDSGNRPRSAWALGFLLSFGALVAVLALWRLLRDRSQPPPVWLTGLTLPCIAVTGAAAIRFFRRGLRDRFPAATARLLFVALTLGLALQFAVFQPYRHTRVVFSLAVGFTLFAAGVLWGARVAARFPRAVRIGDLALINLCLILVGTEVALRLAAVLLPSPLLDQPDAEAKHRVDGFRLRPGVPYFGFPANRDGHYDQEFVPRDRVSSRFLAVSIGDSFSASFVPHDYHYTSVCEETDPDLTVYNMGIHGGSPREYAYLLRNEALKLRPDAIVVSVYLGNDLTGKRRMSGDYWFDRENLLVYQVPCRLLKSRALPAGEEGIPRGATGADLLTPAQVRERFPWVDDPMLEGDVMPERIFQSLTLNSAKRILGVGAGAFAGTLEHFEEIRRLAGAIPVLFMLIPVSFQVEDADWEMVKRGLGREPADRDSPQRVLTAWFRERGIPCLDLLPSLRAVPPLGDGKRHVYGRNDIHFNVRGNRAAGLALAGALKSLLGGE